MESTGIVILALVSQLTRYFKYMLPSKIGKKVMSRQTPVSQSLYDNSLVRLCIVLMLSGQVFHSLKNDHMSLIDKHLMVEMSQIHQ